jgi:hypothetical protein
MRGIYLAVCAVIEPLIDILHLQALLVLITPKSDMQNSILEMRQTVKVSFRKKCDKRGWCTKHDPGGPLMYR